jgi:hypothetical protein
MNRSSIDRHRQRSLSRAGLLVASMLVLSACGGGDAPQPLAELPLTAYQPNPAAPPSLLLDVAVWSGNAQLTDGPRYYVAAGAEGMDVHLGDGRHLQRLGRARVGRLAPVEGVPIDDRQVTILAGADEDTGQLHWYALDAASGALQRMPPIDSVISGGVAALCAQRDAATGRSFLMAVTMDAHLERWEVQAHSERVPGKPHRVAAVIERRLPLPRTGLSCSAHPTNGTIWILDDTHQLQQVALAGEPDALPDVTLIILGDDVILRDIAWLARADEPPLLLATDTAGRRLWVLSEAGQELGSLPLPLAVSAVAASHGALAFLAGDDGSLLFAPWPEVAKRLELTGPGR